MITYDTPGDVLTLTAPSGGVVSGTAYLIGTILVVATKSVAQTLPFEGLVVGVVDLPKVVDEGWTELMKVYWDDSAKKVTGTVGANTLIGVALNPVPVEVTLETDALAADLAIVGFTLQVLDFTQLASDNATVTVTVNGTATVLVEGTDWTAETDDDTTATNLAVAIAAITGVEAAAVTDTVTVVPNSGLDINTTGTGRVRLDGAAR